MPGSDEASAMSLEERFAVVERASQSSDFDGTAWVLMGLLGIVIPLALIVWGYHFAAGG